MIYNVNGYEVRTSKLGRSGYYGVTVSPAWTLDLDRPFIAMQQNPVDDPLLSKWLTAKKRTSLHLGTYADSREAAYVSAMYKKHPEDVLIELYHNRVLSVDFPKELYGIPEFLSLKEAQDYMEAERLKKKNARQSPKPQKISIELALKIAREVTQGRKIKNVSQVRLSIESRCKSGLYIDEDDIRNHIEKIVEYA